MRTESMADSRRLQAADLLEILTGQKAPVTDFRCVPESPACKADVNKRRKAGLPVRFNYRGTLPDLFKTLDAKNRAGWAVYYSVNETDGHGRRLENMTGARAVALDLDGEPLPKKWKLRPHVITESSPGKFQCLWAIRTTTDFSRHRNIMQRLAYRYGGDRGIADITRVLRLPGFLHQKRKPFRSRIIESADPAFVAFDRLTLADFDWLPELPEPEKPARSNGGTVSCKTMAQYFAHLPAVEFGSGKYDDWLRVGMASHFATGGQAIDEWLAWCASDPEFEDDDSQETAAAKWDGFSLERASAVTIGTLDYYGKMHDVPEAILNRVKFNMADAFADDLTNVQDASNDIVSGSIRDMKRRS